MRGRAFFLESCYDQFELSEILPEPYKGEEFPGFGRVNHDFSMLEAIMRRPTRSDWEVALSHLKGVYLIGDKSNGKMYIGSAYAGLGIWARWKSYIETGRGWNVELTKLEAADPEYARRNFRFALLEVMTPETSVDDVIGREAHWKSVLMTREFGYNRN